MSTNPEHQQWIRAALTAHEGPLLRYATRLTRNLETAQDVVQDTFMRLCAADRSQIDGHLSQWLYTVCRNRALEINRKEMRMQALEPTMLAHCPSPDLAPDAALSKRDAMADILTLLDGLPPRQQEIVRLKFQNGKSYKEIAAIMDLTVSNVGFLLHTALKALRRATGAPKCARVYTTIPASPPTCWASRTLRSPQISKPPSRPTPTARPFSTRCRPRPIS